MRDHHDLGQGRAQGLRVDLLVLSDISSTIIALMRLSLLRHQLLRLQDTMLSMLLLSDSVKQSLKSSSTTQSTNIITNLQRSTRKNQNLSKLHSTPEKLKSRLIWMKSSAYRKKSSQVDSQPSKDASLKIEMREAKTNRVTGSMLTEVICAKLRTNPSAERAGRWHSPLLNIMTKTQSRRRAKKTKSTRSPSMKMIVILILTPIEKLASSASNRRRRCIRRKMTAKILR